MERLAASNVRLTFLFGISSMVQQRGLKLAKFWSPRISTPQIILLSFLLMHMQGVRKRPTGPRLVWGRASHISSSSSLASNPMRQACLNWTLYHCVSFSCLNQARSRSNKQTQSSDQRRIYRRSALVSVSPCRCSPPFPFVLLAYWHAS